MAGALSLHRPHDNKTPARVGGGDSWRRHYRDGSILTCASYVAYYVGAIGDRHAAFAQTGLMKSSVLKAEKIVVIHESVFQRRLGSLSADLIAESQTALKQALLIK